MATIVAVGKHAQTIIGGTKEEDKAVPNSLAGAEAVLARGDKEVVFIGNRRWILPFASALMGKGLRILFRKVTIEHGTRGKLGSMVNVARHLFSKGLVDPRPFFTERHEPRPLPKLHAQALAYLETVNEVRRAKHNLLNGLYVLFPEVVPQKSGTEVDNEFVVPKVSDTFEAKKMRSILKDPRPEVVAKSADAPPAIRDIALNSLGRFVSSEVKEKTWVEYQDALAEYETYSEDKERTLGSLRREVSNHALVRRYGDSSTVVVLAALIGDEIYSDWRRLRAFAGLALTRQETSGKKRISRRNGAVRQYLYLFASLTSEGKEMAAEIRENADKRAIKAGKEKASNKTVKVIEGVLKRMRKAAKEARKAEAA